MKSLKEVFFRYFVFLCLVASLFSGFALADEVDPNLLAWWKMDETSGSVVHDSSGNGFHGTKASDVLWSNGALRWTSDYSSGVSFNAVAADLFSTVDDRLTLAFWVKSEATSGSNTAWLYKSNALGDSGTATYGSILCEYPSYDAGWWHMGRADKMTHYGAYMEFIGSWTHWVISKDTNTGSMMLYKNGYFMLAESGKTQSMAGITSFTLGTGDWRWFKGYMKDFRIYDRILDADEIWSLANPADINGDRLVNMKDLEILAYDWLDDSMGNSDINKDGVVNFTDYAIVLKNWRQAGEYYFDSTSGNDNNSGTSPAQAWKSLTKFNNTTFFPGDKIYFKAYSTWTGQLKPKGSGVNGNPIIIDTYGGDIYEQEVKPCFSGNGNVGSTLEVYNVEYWEINNLQITNQGATRAAWRKGVSISASNFGTMRHIHLKNLYVHNVNGLIEKEDGGGAGISWFCSGNTIPTKLDGILIEGCYIKTTDRDGIMGGNAKIGMNTTDPRDSSDWYPSVNVVIRGNLLEDIGGDGIVPIGTDGCIVEHNVINGGACRTYNNTPSQFAAGMWPWSADNTVFQYNEVSGMKGTRDGQGYDCDYNCQNALFQYNYSHNNEGGFMLVCDNDNGIGNINPIVRYNISQNDKERIFHLGAGAKIYNNVIYNGSGSDVHLIKNFAGCTGKSYFSNNIFMSLGTYRFDFNAMKTSMNSFSNNCWVANSWKKEILWYGSTIYSDGRPTDATGITSDPQLVNPGSGGNGIETLDGYKLRATSPCIGTGTTISNNGGYDFWDNILYNGNPDIGAEERY